jgi:HAD superfamily hydrolase (TIGR01509 family)
MLRAAAFDLDGLIVNTEELYRIVGDTILERRGKRGSPELFEQMMGRPNKDALQLMIDWHQLDATVESLQQETDELFADFMDNRLRPMPGLLELLDALDALSLPRAVTTSGRRHYTHRVLTQLAIDHRFSFALTAEDVVRGKPDPEIYVTAARRFGVPPGQLLVLEDSPVGCQAAVRAGACVVAVPSEYTRGASFTGVWFVADSLADPRIVQLVQSG